MSSFKRPLDLDSNSKQKQKKKTKRSKSTNSSQPNQVYPAVSADTRASSPNHAYPFESVSAYTNTSQPSTTISSDLDGIISQIDNENPGFLESIAGDIVNNCNDIITYDLVSPEAADANASIRNLVTMFKFQDDTVGDALCSSVSETELNQFQISEDHPNTNHRRTADITTVLQDVVVRPPFVVSRKQTQDTTNTTSFSSPDQQTKNSGNDTSSFTLVATLPFITQIEDMRVAMGHALTACEQQSGVLESHTADIEKELGVLLQQKEDLLKKIESLNEKKVTTDNKLKRCQQYINLILDYTHELAQI